MTPHRVAPAVTEQPLVQVDTDRSLGGQPAVRRWGVWPAAAATASITGWTARHLSAPVVRTWRPGSGRLVQQHDRLVRGRVAGDADPQRRSALGLLGYGDGSGADYDRLAADHRLVIPDLLGFARSVDGPRPDYCPDAHLAALDEMSAEWRGTDNASLTIGGHSLGGVLALQWAARRPGQVERVGTWVAPLYRTNDEARRHIKPLGPLETLFALEGPIARLACKLTWRAQPLAAGWLAVAMNPQAPIPLARRGAQHTWESPTSGGMQGMIVGDGWQHALDTLQDADVPVTLIAVEPTACPSPASRRGWARQTATSPSRPIPPSHNLPLTDRAWCIARVMGEP